MYVAHFMNLLYTESILLTYLFTEYCYAVEVGSLTEHNILYWIMEAKGWTITFSICDLLDRYYLLTYLLNIVTQWKLVLSVRCGP